MSGIDGKIIAITGASSGMGEATALELARRGAAVVLGARRGRQHWDRQDRTGQRSQRRRRRRHRRDSVLATSSRAGGSPPRVRPGSRCTSALISGQIHSRARIGSALAEEPGPQSKPVSTTCTIRCRHENVCYARSEIQSWARAVALRDADFYLCADRATAKCHHGCMNGAR